MRHAFLHLVVVGPIVALVGCSSSPNPAPSAPTAGSGSAVEAPNIAMASKACVKSVIHPDDDTQTNPNGATDEPPPPEDDRLDDDTVAKPGDGGVCDPRRHANLEAAILKAPHDGKALASVKAWDRKSVPAYRNLVATAFSLQADDETKLASTGFVVPSRLSYDDYTSAYYDIHRAQVPVFVTADSIFHAVFVSYDAMLEKLETDKLIPSLDRAIAKMTCTLPSLAPEYPADTAADLALYLDVARVLLSGKESSTATSTQALALVERVRGAKDLATIKLFGRERQFDATMYTPRGHYASAQDPSNGPPSYEYDLLSNYFRTVMWMSRVEMNLVSRDSQSSTPSLQADPTETPREAVLALALADLAKRSGALDDLEVVDQGFGAFAGRREDVSLRELDALRTKAGITKLEIPASADKLRAAIGNGYRRTVNVHPMPDVANLPVVATAIGPRITADTIALGHAQSAGATASPAGEIGFMLGHDRAGSYLEPTVNRGVLASARHELATSQPTADLYDTWLRAILALAEPTAGARPAFMDTPAYADLRLDTAITAYGQLRHDNMLAAAQRYNEGGCEIPDGYVEPVPTAYDALATYAHRAGEVFAKLNPSDTSTQHDLQRAERIMRVLATISRDEIAGRVLDDTEKHFLAQVVEQRVRWVPDYDSSHPDPTYDGWYFDLLGERAFKAAHFVVDTGTHVLGRARWIDYLGAKGPRMGVFVVDAGGAPRMMVGPVAQGFGTIQPVEKRATDQSKLASAAPWEASYAIAAPSEPDLLVLLDRGTVLPPPPTSRAATHPPSRKPENMITLQAPHPIGAVTIELRDHHFQKIGSVSANVTTTDEIKLPIPPALRAKTESVVVVVGAFRGRMDLTLTGFARHAWGSTAKDEP